MRAPEAGPVRLTTEQAHELIEATIVADRAIKRRGSGFVVGSVGVARLYGLPPDEAVRVVERLSDMLRARKAAETECLRALTGTAHRAARDGGAGGGSDV